MDAFTRSSNALRVAWSAALDDDGKFTDGAVEDKFTGYWEVMSVPTTEIPILETVSVGVKKGDSGTNAPLLGYGVQNALETSQLELPSN